MKKISFSRLSAPELYTLGKRIQTLIEKEALNNTYITDVLALLNSSLINLSSIMGRIPGSGFTDHLFIKDQSRDNAYIGFRDFIKANLNHVSPEISLAAQRIYSTLDRNGLTLYNFGYAVETARLNVLLKELLTDSAQTDLAIISALSWFENMRNKQEDFEKTYQEKINKESAENLPLLKAEKRKTSRYTSNLLSYVDQQAELDPQAYAALIEKINEIITDIMSIARSRLSKRAKEEGEQIPENNAA